MGMYTQVCGVLNVGSIDWGHRVLEVSDAVQKAAEVSGCDYWRPSCLLNHVTVLAGGNGSVFVAIAVEGKIIGYSNDWQNFIRKICELLPTTEGRIEWIYETGRVNNENCDELWYVKNGVINIKWETRYRKGYGNGC